MGDASSSPILHHLPNPVPPQNILRKRRD